MSSIRDSMSPLAESRVGLPLWIKELSDGGEIPLAFGRVIHRNWKNSMNAMLQHGLTLRGTILDDAATIIDKLTTCTQAGMLHYCYENEIPHGILSADDMILWGDWESTLKNASLEMPANYRSQLLCTIAHAYLKDALERAEYCRVSMRGITSALPSHADEQILLLQFRLPDTLDEFDEASEARSRLRWKWHQMCKKMAQEIALQKSTFSQTLSVLEHGHATAVKYYPRCKTTRNNVHESTQEQRSEALQKFDMNLKLISCIDNRISDEDALVAFAYLKYWDTLEAIRGCIRSLMEQNPFDSWLAGVKNLEQAVQPIRRN